MKKLALKHLIDQPDKIVPQDAAALWPARREQQLQDEWRLRNQMFELARESMARWIHKQSELASLQGIVALSEFASRLGRLSSGLPADKTDLNGHADATLPIEFFQALDKIYGPATDIPTKDQ